MSDSLRLRAVGMLVLLLLIAVIGGSLALESSYDLAVLAGHIVLALLLVGLSAHVLLAAFRSFGSVAKVGGTIAFASVLGATISGTVFLLGGGSNAALDGMEGFTIVALVGIVLLLVGGGAVKAPPSTAPA